MTQAPALDTVGARWSAAVARHPAKAALVCGERGADGVLHYTTTSYAELDERTHRYAAALLREGVRKSTRTVLACPPGADLFALVLALLRIGAVPVVADPGLGLRASTRCYRHVRPEAFVGPPRLHAYARANRVAFGTVRLWLSTSVTSLPGTRSIATGGTAPDSEPICEPVHTDDLACIGFTTGSTGPAKPVESSHGGLVAMAGQLAAVHGLTEDDVSLVLSPFLAVADLMNGLTCVLPPVRPAAVASAGPALLADALIRFRVTTFFASPPVLRDLVEYLDSTATRVPAVRKVISGGAPVPPALMTRARAVFHPAARLVTTYGSSEALPICSVDHTGVDDRPELGTPLGRPVPGAGVRLVRVAPGPLRALDEVAAGEIGEIVVSGPHVSTAYHRAPAHDLAHKIRLGGVTWHRTGDLARFDDNGVLWFQGRINQIVRTSYGDLLPVPCERVLDRHPEVLRTAVVEVRNVPVCCVELRRGVPRAGWPAIRAELRTTAAAHEATRPIEHFLLHPGLPVDIRHNAKIRRELLAEWAAGQLDDQARSGVADRVPLRLVPLAGWAYVLLGLARPFRNGRLRALWWIVTALSVVGHAVQLPSALRRARAQGGSQRRAVLGTMLFGVTWRRGRR
ncbi:AMP-binding protein [Lentzea aerocolonigenes]|uniref:AMP-binding protein n=1 Tax=Lentzea aerocolonigenes TaxID=68170 RepID=UPI0005ED33E4|nr:AMP-binding protein [Lentzea aerocolonigenes]